MTRFFSATIFILIGAAACSFFQPAAIAQNGARLYVVDSSERGVGWFIDAGSNASLLSGGLKPLLQTGVQGDVMITPLEVGPDQIPSDDHPIFREKPRLAIVHYSAFEGANSRCNAIASDLPSQCNQTFFDFVSRLRLNGTHVLVFSRYYGLCDYYRRFFWIAAVDRRPKTEARLSLFDVNTLNFNPQSQGLNLMSAAASIELGLKTLSQTTLASSRRYCAVGP